MPGPNTVFSKISKLSLPTVVEKKAIQIYNNFPDSVKKWRAVNSKVYLCVTESYRAQGMIYDVDELQDELKIGNNKKKNIIKNAARSGYNLVIHRYMPQDFVERYCGYIGIRPEQFTAINQYIDILLEFNPLLEEKSPEAVAAGVIAYYAKTNGFAYDKSKYPASVRKSANDITLIEKQMCLAHNT